MKEISDEMQMMIFDLLEGNLNKMEEIKLLEQIEMQPNLKAEYEIMQLTYLTLEPESIDTDFKLSLLKKTPIIWFTPSYIGRAAALILLFGLGSYGVYHEFNQPVVNDNIVKNKPIINENTTVKPLDELNIPNDKDLQKLAQLNETPQKSDLKMKPANEVKKQAMSQVFEKSITKSMAVEQNKSADNLNQYILPKVNKETAILPGIKTPIIASNVKREMPVDIIIIEEGDIQASQISQSEEQSGFLTRLVNSTRNSLKHGQTPDINLNFNRSNFKVALGIDNHNR